MTIKVILTEPNKILRQVSKPVEKVGKEEQNLMDDMLDTMYAANGIGLAAIQIGIPKRIIVMDISKDENKKEPRYFVNPKIKNKDYNVSIKDLILLESLISDGVVISKKYKNMFNFEQSNIPTDIQLLLSNNETAMVLLRLIEIIGEDDLENLDPDSLYFITSILNKLNLDSIRNKLLLKVLPLKI